MGGLTRGLQLMADFLSIILLAASKGNAGALMDALVVAKVWCEETVDQGGKVRISAWALLAGADPWKRSRLAYHGLAEKWRGKI